MSALPKWTCIVFILVMTHPSATQLKGTIVDSEGAAIRGARILIHWDQSGATVGLRSNVGLEKDLTVDTGSKGDFTAELPPGFYDVLVTANGFSPDCRKVRIKFGETTIYDAKLKADPLVTKELGDKFQ